MRLDEVARPQKQAALELQQRLIDAGWEVSDFKSMTNTLKASFTVRYVTMQIRKKTNTQRHVYEVKVYSSSVIMVIDKHHEVVTSASDNDIDRIMSQLELIT